MAAGSSFDERIRYLADAVGSGDLVGRVKVDQVYAHYQHEVLDLYHPQGGGPKYLEGPLYANARDYVARLADTAVTEHGSDLVQGMADNMEDLSDAVQREAPVLWGDLRNSGHPTVTDDGRTVYDRPPKARRLTDQELEVKSRWVPSGYYSHR